MTCGAPRKSFELDRDEPVLGTGYPMERRRTRVECSCPLNRWPQSAAISVATPESALFSSGFDTTNRSSQLMTKSVEARLNKKILVMDERTPCVCLQPDIAPLYAFDLFPEAEFVTFVSPGLFLFGNTRLPDTRELQAGNLYAPLMPSPLRMHYRGLFVAHRDLRVLFELAKDRPPELWWNFVCSEADKNGRLRELSSPAILFPLREKPTSREPPAISLDGLPPDDRERLLGRMYISPRPWREACQFFNWAEQLLQAELYPAGTRIALDCNTAGIGDLIDIAHIVEALKAENPGVEVKVYTKNAKRAFVDLYGNYGAVEYAQVKHEFPPNPWHKLDETKFAKTRIENWAIYCGASAPRIAKPILSDATIAFADEFVKNLPAPRVLLSPISTCPTRSWPLERYEALGILLEKAGMSVIVIDEPEGIKTRRMPFTRLYGQGAEREAAVIAKCDLLAGNDSGMAHLSCSLGIPTLVLCGPTDGSKVFGWYKKAHWMDGPLPCAGCYFYRKNGWREECEHGCLSILQLGVNDVFYKCLSILKDCPAGRLQ